MHSGNLIRVARKQFQLDGGLVRNGRHRLRRVLGDRDGTCLPGENMDTLQRYTF